MESFATIVGSFCLIALLIGAAFLYDIFAYSYVADIMWDWFAYRINSNLPNLTQNQFMAIFALKSILFSQYISKDELKDEYKKDSKTYTFLILLLRPWFILLFGWGIKVVMF